MADGSMHGTHHTIAFTHLYFIGSHDSSYAFQIQHKSSVRQSRLHKHLQHLQHLQYPDRIVLDIPLACILSFVCIVVTCFCCYQDNATNQCCNSFAIILGTDRCSLMVCISDCVNWCMLRSIHDAKQGRHCAILQY